MLIDDDVRTLHPQYNAAVRMTMKNALTLSSDEVKARHGEQAARVQDYLRAHPEALRKSPIAFARR